MKSACGVSVGGLQEAPIQQICLGNEQVETFLQINTIDIHFEETHKYVALSHLRLAGSGGRSNEDGPIAKMDINLLLLLCFSFNTTITRCRQ